MPKRTLTQEQKDKIKQLYSKGNSLIQICTKLNLGYWTVKYHVDENYKQQVKEGGKKYYKKKCQAISSSS